MGEEQALAAVQCLNVRHILRRQREVEQVEVLLHTLLVDRLRDNDNAALHEEAECGLRGGLAAFRAD